MYIYKDKNIYKYIYINTYVYKRKTHAITENGLWNNNWKDKMKTEKY